jgi:DNA-binding transcriptional regulator GbsR (MarR family)
VSELSDFIDDAVVNWLSQKPMRLKELVEASHANPSHLRASLKRLLRAGKVRRFRKNRELIYSIAQGARQIERS